MVVRVSDETLTRTTSLRSAQNYSYNIRHMYGKEGKRQSYSAFSSTTIIMGPRPNPSEVGSHHGCPFAHTSDSSLSALLSKMGVGGADKGEIMNHKKAKNFQLACAKHFEAQHPNVAKMTGPEGVEMDGVGNHPNAWFAASVKYWEKMGGGEKKLAEGKAAGVGVKGMDVEMKQERVVVSPGVGQGVKA